MAVEPVNGEQDGAAIVPGRGLVLRSRSPQSTDVTYGTGIEFGVSASATWRAHDTAPGVGTTETSSRLGTPPASLPWRHPPSRPPWHATSSQGGCLRRIRRVAASSTDTPSGRPPRRGASCRRGSPAPCLTTALSDQSAPPMGRAPHTNRCTTVPTLRTVITAVTLVAARPLMLTPTDSGSEVGKDVLPFPWACVTFRRGAAHDNGGTVTNPAAACARRRAE